MKKIISLLLSLAVAGTLSFTAITAFAGEVKYSDIVIGDDELLQTGEDAQSENAKVIQSALNEAEDKATDSNVYRIYLPKGEYHIDTTLKISSNSQLYLDEDTTLVQDAGQGENLIRAAGSVDDKENALYDGFKNIKIDGGKWDMQFNGSCAMRFGHCSNLSINNVHISNVKNAHHIEAAAVDNLSITDSTFTSTMRTNSNSCEAVQLDIMHDKVHFPKYEKFDDTPNKNITISGCTFYNLYSGIGTRSGVVGKYFNNIVIENNKFEDIREKAISCFNYKSSKIINNTFTDVNSGISFEYLPNNIDRNDYSQRMYIANDGKIDKIKSDCSTVISNNVMTLHQVLDSSYGIFVYGGKVSKDEAKKAGIVAGNYMIDNLSVNNNSISIDEASKGSRGISFTGVNNSEISSNNLIKNSSATDEINAINIGASSKNIVENNSISGGFNNGISLYDKDGSSSKNVEIVSNSISNVNLYAIRVSNSSFATIKSDNNISPSKKSICLYSNDNFSQNLPAVQINSKGYSLRNKPLVTVSSSNSNTGYKISRAFYGGSFKQIATVDGTNVKFEDKSAGAFSKNYYRITPYVNSKGTIIIGKNYKDIAF